MVFKRIFWQLLLVESYEKTEGEKLKEFLYALLWKETGLLKIKIYSLLNYKIH